ncbi:hypothetical protein JCM11491_002075 [Sporobolomyces phaffii]
MTSAPSQDPNGPLAFLSASPAVHDFYPFDRIDDPMQSHSTALSSLTPTSIDLLQQHPPSSRVERPTVSQWHANAAATERQHDSVAESATSEPLALQLSFDSPHPHLPPSVPALVPSVAPPPSTLSTPPLQPFEFLPLASSWPPPSVDRVQPSPSSKPSYVHTFRLPVPATPPAFDEPTSNPPPNSKAPSLDMTSPSLSAALSILDSASPWTGRSPERDTMREPVELGSSSLFTSLESAAETLRRPVVRNYPPLDYDASSRTIRPKPCRSSTEPYRSSTSDSSPRTPKSPSRSKGKKRPEGHIPRAPNAWILYRSARVKQLTEGGNAPKLQSDLSKLVGTMWREESAEVKEMYARKASIEAKVHAEKYPGYCYRPTPSRQPRRSLSKKEESGSVSRKRSKTTSALEAHLSGFSLASSTSPRGVPSVLLPSPFAAAESPTSTDYSVSDYSIGGSCSYEDDPFSLQSATRYDATLPPTPNSSASEAWTVFQASGLVSYDYGVPSPSSNEPYSAPANLSTFPFTFSQPPPIFEPFDGSPESSSPTFFPCGSTSSASSAHTRGALPGAPGETATFEDFLASLPVDQSGQASIPVPASEHSEWSRSDYGEQQSQDSRSQESPSDVPIDLSRYLYL